MQSLIQIELAVVTDAGRRSRPRGGRASGRSSHPPPGLRARAACAVARLAARLEPEAARRAIA